MTDDPQTTVYSHCYFYFAHLTKKEVKVSSEAKTIQSLKQTLIEF